MRTSAGRALILIVEEERSRREKKFRASPDAANNEPFEIHGIEQCAREREREGEGEKNERWKLSNLREFREEVRAGGG